MSMRSDAHARRMARKAQKSTPKPVKHAFAKGFVAGTVIGLVKK